MPYSDWRRKRSYGCSSLLNYGCIVSQRKTFVNEKNTTDSSVVFLTFLFTMYKCIQKCIWFCLFSVHHSHTGCQDLTQNGDTGMAAVAAVFYHHNESQRVFVRIHKACKHGVGVQFTAQLAGTGLGADGQAREIPVAVDRAWYSPPSIQNGACFCLYDAARKKNILLPLFLHY